MERCIVLADRSFVHSITVTYLLAYLTVETREIADEALRMNRFNQKKYSKSDWYSIYVSVIGTFLKALESAVRY